MAGRMIITAGVRCGPPTTSVLGVGLGKEPCSGPK